MKLLQGKKVRKIIQKLFALEEWHITPFNEKIYAIEIVQYINWLLSRYPILRNYKIVEIGCGLGDIISNIRICNKNKMGIDVESNAIKVAHIMHPFIEFDIGSFDNVENEKIGVLIAVNFLHLLDEQTVLNIFFNVTRRNRIKYIIVDKVQKPAYKYEHDYNAIMQRCGYKLYHKSRRYEAYKNSSRWILTYCKVQK